jgi:hypothetical protein
MLKTLIIAYIREIQYFGQCAAMEERQQLLHAGFYFLISKTAT